MIAYLYREDEYLLLRHLCGGEPEAGLDGERAEKAARSLAGRGVLTLLDGGEALADPVAAFLFYQLAAPRYVVAREDGPRFLRAEKIFLRLDRQERSGARRLTPLQTLEEWLALLREEMESPLARGAWTLRGPSDGGARALNGFPEAEELITRLELEGGA